MTGSRKRKTEQERERILTAGTGAAQEERDEDGRKGVWTGQGMERIFVGAGSKMVMERRWPLVSIAG